jgi:regulatory protein
MRGKRAKVQGSARESALRLLAQRDHSSEELRRKLKAKQFHPEEIEEVVQEMEGRRILDDDRYARRLASHLAREKLFGPQRIRQKLFQKGFSPDRVREAVEKAEEGLASSARLQMVLKNKLKGQSLKRILPREREKLANYLRQHGFLWEEIQDVFQEAGGFTEE